MSEDIRLLLRLLSFSFSQCLLEDSLNSREPLSDEAILPNLPLWLALLADLASSVPREHFHAQPGACRPLQPAASGRHASSFQILETDPESRSAVSSAVMSRVAFVWSHPGLIVHDGTYRARRRCPPNSASIRARSSAFRPHTRLILRDRTNSQRAIHATVRHTRHRPAATPNCKVRRPNQGRHSRATRDFPLSNAASESSRRDRLNDPCMARREVGSPHNPRVIEAHCEY